MAKRQRKRGSKGSPPGKKDRHPLLGGPLRARQETLTFVLVNVLDYFMTYIVLYMSHMHGSPLRYRLMEGNRIAAYFINHWGPIKGMLGFKLIMVVLICVITQAIAYRSELAAQRVLNLGTLITGCVVIYSLMLLVRALA